MATIPLGNFGQTVVQPGRQQRVFGEQAGSITGRAVADLAQTGQDIALKDLQEQTRAGVEAYNREAQTTAARVRISKANDLDEAADTLAADVKAGRVTKDKAEEEWQTRSRSILDGAFDGVDERYRGQVQAEAEGLAQRKTGGIRQAVTLRDQEDTRANILTLGEEYQRRAIKDRPGALAEYETLLDNLGPAAGYGPDDIAKQKQAFREGTAYTQAFGVAKGAQTLGQVREAQKALASDALSDISPQKRMELDVFLTGKENALIQKAEHAANAAARAQEARLNRARAEFESAQGRLMTGIPDNDAQLLQTVQALSGTPYMDTYKAQQNQARTLGGFASKSIPEQQREVDALYAERSKTGGGDQINGRIRLAEKALDASKAEAQEDNLRAYVRRTPGESVDPIDLTSPQAFIAGIQKRLSLANRASLWSGKPSSVLMSDEAPAAAEMLNALTVQQRASALATLGRNIGPQAAAGLAAQIDKKDKALALALQYGTASTTEGRTTAEIILKGQAALKDKTVKPETPAVDGWKGQIAKEIDGVYRNQKQADDVKEAAFLILSGLQSEGTGNVRQAVNLAAGGRIVERNGSKIPLPAGVSEDDFDAKLRSLTPANFANQVKGGEVRVGGQPVPLDAFVQSLPDAQLINAGRGRYNVLHGGRVVTNAKGMPITITAK